MVQAFPFESRSYPLLWTGAYSEQERYTQEDMADVVEYARQRGIRVLIEFDVPGHAESWCTGYPDVCPSVTCPVPLDPSTEKIFDLMKGLWGEVTGNATGGGIFPDDYIHLGGDEVDTTCWTTTPRIQQWLTDQRMSADDAYMYIVDRAQQIVHSMGRHSIHWEEVFLHFGTKLDKNTIIHIWLDHETLGRVVAAGYRGILSNSDVWYLDHLQVPWTSFYLNEPYQGITDPNQQKVKTERKRKRGAPRLERPLLIHFFVFCVFFCSCDVFCAFYTLRTACSRWRGVHVGRNRGCIGYFQHDLAPRSRGRRAPLVAGRPGRHQRRPAPSPAIPLPPQQTRHRRWSGPCAQWT